MSAVTLNLRRKVRHEKVKGSGEAIPLDLLGSHDDQALDDPMRTHLSRLLQSTSLEDQMTNLRKVFTYNT